MSQLATFAGMEPGAIAAGRLQHRTVEVLVVEDSEPERRRLTAALDRAGYATHAICEGSDALRCLFRRRPSLVVLGAHEGAMEPVTVLARLREASDVPVLLVADPADELRRVRAFAAGADDVVRPSVGGPELRARVTALLRRCRPAEPLPERYDDGCVCVDAARREVKVSGRPVRLTPLEYRLLLAFVRHPDQVLSHAQLLDLAWGDPAGGTRDQVKLYVGQLRRKLGDPHLIATCRGFGYRYVPTPAALAG